ncbi:thiol reductant ABC exporter subunit CydD [Sporosarcina sp. Marseille-Q4063]|uniref:thiol reductant ABC exporter subunit CydD n=1 Tax=Sporosarcina sp. Marseille-Q4063 TaxID=2810514 RepID=UPI001BAF3266|nr:thiol reductant ABC exporter subunit CydD [Sporosarcina sp. Marseille-Q4063]QUW23196.1 thiol reductant ABC exporter subunit CydD [Sporosarcina sp. Marseille-Q4063]
MERKKGLPSCPGSRSLYVLLTILTVVEAGAIILQAIFLARSVTYLFQGASVSAIGQDLLLFMLFFALRHVFSHIQQLLAERFAVRTTMALREQLTSAYFKLGPRFAQVNGTGRLVTLAIEGIDQIKTYLEITIPRMIQTFIVPAVLAIYVFTLDKTSSIILIATVPIIIIFMILLGMAAQKTADAQYETYRILSNHFIDTLKGLETLTYLGKSEAHEGKIARVSKRYRKATMKTLRIAFLSSFALDFFTSLSIAFVAVSLGFRLIDGTVMLLPALTILVLAPEYFLPIRQVGTDYHATLDGQIALEQVEEIIKEQKETAQPAIQSTIEWEPTTKIGFHELTVNRDDEETEPILNGLQFSWEGNGVIGIVGESGAGKSTFIDIIAGFLQPTSGMIEVNGEGTTSLMRYDWTSQIAYIPQHPYIFPTSIIENIRFYEPDATDEDVKRVIDEVGLDALISQLPRKLDEQIGEGGRPLSGGQEQRIAMARALLSKRPIIILDEPTAHLDIETEYELKQSMLRLFEGKLVFLATHRVHWMKEMDHIIVLKDGCLVASGTHEELIKQEHSYKELIRHNTGRGEAL